MVFTPGCSVTETKLLPLLHCTQFSSQKHNWKQFQSVEITPIVELKITLSGLKIQHLKLKAKPSHLIPARCFCVWSLDRTHPAEGPRSSILWFPPLADAHFLPNQKTGYGKASRGKTPFNEFLYSKARFWNLSSLLVTCVIIKMVGLSMF